jgi:hypothetical protein
MCSIPLGWRSVLVAPLLIAAPIVERSTISSLARYIGFWWTRYISSVYPDCTAWAVAKVPVNGRFPTGELTRRHSGLFATSAILGGAEAHSHIAPP